ncbi:surface antigen BspA-like [Trichomonas vaginalis G3]|uniref:Surface antigen BspA-like n=1 Tax=Trichomonas vaginalis (strain ATCC PRA-98 / G3) TaxID=412133 RepID=A2F6P7_TRIV3|nr:leucine-rich repeats (6 copies)-containing protein [Trichomonas vaginalis G3]EAX99436.1 surface antigen BspA-like [Trichomonas vaginalis G3]KAI5516129.1 leucine-rich repeats (6 copies)-containing protein [Trichomonas vaginalis G3]|eukprot:XP_001312366.1 surface antigen BspA-like [Trichomonas vaginalis G3]
MFSGCTLLETIDLGGVKTIANFSFQNTKLTNLDLKSVTTIQYKSFFNSKIQHLTISTNLSSIDLTSFKGCSQLNQITLGSSITKFELLGFEDCPPITFDLQTTAFKNENNIITKDTTLVYIGSGVNSIPSTITEIGKNAFIHSTITKITIDREISFSSGFSNFKSLKEVTISGINSIPSYAFYNCVNLETVSLPSTVTSIGDYAFYNCKLLSTINLESVKNFGKHSFENCIKLTTIKLNSGVFDEYSFYNCVSLKNVEFISHSESHSFKKYCFSRTGLEKFELYNPDFEEGVFSYAEKLQEIKLETSTTPYPGIPEYMFEHTSLTSVDIQFSYINDFSFSFIPSLTSFVIPDECDSISTTSFLGSENVQFRFRSSTHPVFLLGNHELIRKFNNELILTYGKLPSTYVVPDYVSHIAANSIQSLPKYSADGKVEDYGVTTLVIPNTVNTNGDMENRGAYTPYLHNLCYGPKFQVGTFVFETVQNIYVSSAYDTYIWKHYGAYYENSITRVIKDKCDSSVPFENYAKDDYFTPIKTDSLDFVKDQHLIQFENCEDTDVPVPQPGGSTTTTTTTKAVDPQDSSNSTSSTQETKTEEFIIEEDPTKKSMSPLLIALIVICVFEVITICTMVIIFIVKSNEEESSTTNVEFNAEKIETGNIDATMAFTADNPIFGANLSDDPFAQDFNDDKSDQGFFDGGLVDPEEAN